LQEEVLKIIDNNENVAIAEIAKLSGVSKTTVSRILGLILADIENPFYSRLAKGVSDTAETLKLY